jgi:hypothetical protein
MFSTFPTPRFNSHHTFHFSSLLNQIKAAPSAILSELKDSQGACKAPYRYEMRYVAVRIENRLITR